MLNLIQYLIIIKLLILLETRQQENQLYAYKNSVSEKELANFESNLAEEEYLSKLSFDEKVKYYEEQGESKNDNARESKTSSLQERSGKKENNNSVQEGRRRSYESGRSVDELTRVLGRERKNDERSLGSSRQNQSQQEQRLKDYAKQNWFRSFFRLKISF